MSIVASGTAVLVESGSVLREEEASEKETHYARAGSTALENLHGTTP
jgi:hypothetical protein